MEKLTIGVLLLTEATTAHSVRRDRPETGVGVGKDDKIRLTGKTIGQAAPPLLPVEERDAGVRGVHDRDRAVQALRTDPDKQEARVRREHDEVARTEEKVALPNRGIGCFKVGPELAPKGPSGRARREDRVPIGAAHAGRGARLLHTKQVDPKLPDLLPDQGGASRNKAAASPGVGKRADIEGAEPDGGNNADRRPGRSVRLRHKKRGVHSGPGFREDEVPSAELGVRGTATRRKGPDKLPLDRRARDKSRAKLGRQRAGLPLASTLGKTVGEFIPRVAVVGPHVAELHGGDLANHQEQGGTEAGKVSVTAIPPVGLGSVGSKERVRLDHNTAHRLGNNNPDKGPDHRGKLHAIGVGKNIGLNDRPRPRRFVVQGSDEVVAPPLPSHDHSRPAKRKASPRAGGGGTISEDEKLISTGSTGRRRAGKGKAGRRVQLTYILDVNAQPESRTPFC